jgi:hypothetical protein
MQPFGTDRVRPGEGERVFLSSRYSKGWNARVEKTLTTAQFPGTAVLWEERYFEVVVAETLPQGGVRYTLEPWLEQHAMRVVDRYDAEAEDERVAAWRKSIVREKQRKTVNAVAFLAGHLPVRVQEAMGSELGIIPLRMTYLSLLTELAIVAAILFDIVRRVSAEEAIPNWEVILFAFFFIEMGIRYMFAFTQARPIGSTIGLIVYLIVYAGRGKREMPNALVGEKGLGLYIREEEEDTKLRDAFLIREPLITLLSPADQERVAQRFHYDYRRQSANVAVIFLIFSVAGVITSLHTLRAHSSLSALISLLCAAGLALEQLFRLASFRRGPTGSILGVLARPFARKLL